tara:strand:+ start:9173 stop:10975 length:1803 start_codon:yes stop_codon:yes gene_type:complete
MCGIFGSQNSTEQISNNFIFTLQHRGPDDHGSYVDRENKLLLSHFRLSIIDPVKGSSQPMYDSTGNYVIIFNGEIYNYLELRQDLISLGYSFKTKSDTEVILNSFVAWGKECLLKFRGMFAFCIYNKKSNQLFLARDRFGIKPLIYTCFKNQFYFSSELKPFLNCDLFHKKINQSSLSNIYNQGSVSQPNTIFENFYNLEPGSWMEVKNGKIIDKKRYYVLHDYISRKQNSISYSEATHLIRNSLEDAINHHLVSDVDVGAFLSGGLDSAAIVALMQKGQLKKIKTFSLGFKGYEGVVDENKEASETADFLNTDHSEILIDDQYIAEIFDDFIASIDQPSIDGLNTYIISKEASKSVKVVVSGLGGDELFFGYDIYKEIISRKMDFISIIPKIAEKLHLLRPNRLTRRLSLINKSPEEALMFLRNKSNAFKILNEYEYANNSEIFKELSEIQRICNKDLSGYMVDTLLRDNDINSMASSLELRPIFLDHSLVEQVMNVPDKYKMMSKSKQLLYDSVSDLLPPDIISRKKKGFELPFTIWMNGILNDRYNSLLSDNLLEKIFNKNYIKKLRNRASRKKLNWYDWVTLVYISWIKHHNISYN